MNSENLKGHGFHERTASEQRELARLGGIASGEARRKKADFRRTLNLLLTAEIDNPEWTPFLKALGLDSTLESAVNAAMIREAMNGNVKAYEAIRDTLGQTTKSEEDLEEQRIRTATAKTKAGMDESGFEDDGFLDALAGTAAEDWQDMDNTDEESDIQV